MSEFTGEIHPLADFFAMLPDDELQELADDIAANGQTHSIVLDASGRLVDGRNRLAACERAGVEPEFVVRDDIKTDEQAAALIRSENNRRRNQTTGQQAATDALLLDAMGLRRDGRWEDSALRDPNSGRSKTERNALTQAGFILDNNRALLLKVAAGYPISKAYDETKDAQETAAGEAKDRQTLRDLAPDLYRQVTDETLTLREAVAAYVVRHEKELAAEQADLDRRRDQSTALARSIAALGALTVAESRDRIRSEWDADLSAVNPGDVTPKNMRAIAAALTKLADEWSAKK